MTAPTTLPGGLSAPLAVLLVFAVLVGVALALSWLTDPRRLWDLLDLLGAETIRPDPEEREPERCPLCTGPLSVGTWSPGSVVFWRSCLSCGRFALGHFVGGDEHES